MQFCRARPCTHRVAARALRSAVVESEQFRKLTSRPGEMKKLCGGVGMAEQVFADGHYESGQRAMVAVRKDLCYPGSRTRDVICNAAHCRIPLAREPSANGFPPSPCATTHPTARFIKDNIVLCGTAGCFTVTLTAR